MVAKTAPRKPYNTVTAAAIRQHVATNIYTLGSAVDKLAAPIVSRLDELGAEVGDRFDHSTLVRELLEGKPFDAAAYSETIRENHLEHLLADAELKLLTDALVELRHRRDDWEPRELGDQELAYLNEQLAVLVDDVKRIAADHPDAIGLDDVQRHPELGNGLSAQFTATDTYQHIRARQLSIATRAGLTGSVQRFALAVSGRLRDAVNTEEYWLDLRRQASDAADRWQRRSIPRLKMSEDRARLFSEVPDRRWPETTSPTLAWPDETVQPWEYLAWICTNAEPWVPALDELMEAHETNIEAVTVGPDAKRSRRR